MSSDLREAIRGAFIICVSPGDGTGYVKIGFRELEGAQELHRLIVEEPVAPEPSALIEEVAESIVGSLLLTEATAEGNCTLVVNGHRLLIFNGQSFVLNHERLVLTSPANPLNRTELRLLPIAGIVKILTSFRLTPDCAREVPIQVTHEARVALNEYLYNEQTGTGEGFSEFILAAIETRRARGPKESPILAWEAWVTRYVKDRGKLLTPDEYGVGYAAFIAAHLGEGPHSVTFGLKIEDAELARLIESSRARITCDCDARNDLPPNAQRMGNGHYHGCLTQDDDAPRIAQLITALEQQVEGRREAESRLAALRKDFRQLKSLACQTDDPMVGEWVEAFNARQLTKPTQSCGQITVAEYKRLEAELEIAEGALEHILNGPIDADKRKAAKDALARLAKPTQSGEATCPECKGAGIVSSYSGTELTARDCPRCTQSGEPIHDWAWALAALKAETRVRLPDWPVESFLFYDNEIMEIGPRIRLHNMGGYRDVLILFAEWFERTDWQLAPVDAEDKQR